MLSLSLTQLTIENSGNKCRKWLCDYVSPMWQVIQRLCHIKMTSDTSDYVSQGQQLPVTEVFHKQTCLLGRPQLDVHKCLCCVHGMFILIFILLLISQLIPSGSELYVMAIYKKWFFCVSSIKAKVWRWGMIFFFGHTDYNNSAKNQCKL